MRRILTSLLAVAALAAPATAAQRDPDAQLAKLLAGRVAGKPQACLSVGRSESSQIVDGRAIVYRDGRTLWVNRPRTGAATLRDDDVLLTRVTGSQLCRVDSVRLLDRTGFFQRGFVVLGDFVPYRLPRKS